MFHVKHVSAYQDAAHGQIVVGKRQRGSSFAGINMSAVATALAVMFHVKRCIGLAEPLSFYKNVCHGYSTKPRTLVLCNSQSDSKEQRPAGNMFHVKHC